MVQHFQIVGTFVSEKMWSAFTRDRYEDMKHFPQAALRFILDFSVAAKL